MHLVNVLGSISPRKRASKRWFIKWKGRMMHRRNWGMEVLRQNASLNLGAFTPSVDFQQPSFSSTENTVWGTLLFTPSFSSSSFSCSFSSISPCSSLQLSPPSLLWIHIFSIDKAQQNNYLVSLKSTGLFFCLTTHFLFGDSSGN